MNAGGSGGGRRRSLRRRAAGTGSGVPGRPARGGIPEDAAVTAPPRSIVDPGFRLSVHAADRPAGARGERSFGRRFLRMPREPEIERWDPWGVILSGGPQSVYASGRPDPPFPFRTSDKPLLGVCWNGRPSLRSWRRRRAGPRAGVRSGGIRPGLGLRSLSGTGGSRNGMDVARRLRLSGAAGVHGHGLHGVGPTIGAFRARSGGSHAIRFHPEVRHARRTALSSSRIFSSGSAASAPTGR